MKSIGLAVLFASVAWVAFFARSGGWPQTVAVVIVVCLSIVGIASLMGRYVANLYQDEASVARHRRAMDELGSGPGWHR